MHNAKPIQNGMEYSAIFHVIARVNSDFPSVKDWAANNY